MKIGFTGTHYGCTAKQKEALRRLLHPLFISEFHHGDCVGADQQAHSIVLGRCEVHIHPGIVHSSKRANCDGYKHYPPLPPLERNKVIVDSTDILIACPNAEETLRSGTWATIRYARKQGKPVTIVWPDGRVENDRASAIRQ